MSIPAKQPLKKKKDSSIMGAARKAEAASMDGTYVMTHPDWYALFRDVVASAAHKHKREFSDRESRDWIFRCFDDKRVFEERFPTERAQQEFVERLLALQQRVSMAVRNVLRRVAKTGLTYEDIERLQYEFPTADADA